MIANGVKEHTFWNRVYGCPVCICVYWCSFMCTGLSIIVLNLGFNKGFGKMGSKTMYLIHSITDCLFVKGMNTEQPIWLNRALLYIFIWIYTSAYHKFTCILDWFLSMCIHCLNVIGCTLSMRHYGSQTTMRPLKLQNIREVKFVTKIISSF